MTDNRYFYYAADSAFATAAKMHNARANAERKALAKQIAAELRKDSGIEAEYIGLEEALQVTGLAEATLKKRLRRLVTQYGHDSWNRKEFFDFWEDVRNKKQQRKDDNLRTRAIQHANGY